MYSIICEGKTKCTDYEKCKNKYQKTGQDTCIKKKHYQQYSCDSGNCKHCTHIHQCQLILPNTKGLQKTTTQINDLKIKIQNTQTNIQYLLDGGTNLNKGLDDLRLLKEEQVDELRKLRNLEKSKLNLLRKRAYRRIYS